MEKIHKSLSDTNKKYNLIREKDSVLIAVSGGPDSTALFHLLVRLFPDSVKGAAYIDHHLRPSETGAEITHVETICRLAGVSFHRASVNVPVEKKSSGESTEECARRLRYRALEQIRTKTGADLLAVGHTSDDLVEEVLIRLVRGSGLKGLAGISPSHGRVVRPLINLSKKQVLDYLERNNLHYCLDSSNLSRNYLRNRVRLDLLPLLEEKFNPSIRQTIRRTAEIIADEEAFIASETDRRFKNLVKSHVSPFHKESGGFVYTTAEFNDLDIALRRRLIEKIFHLSGADPNFQAIEDVLRLSLNAQTGAELHMNSGLTVRRSADEIIFSLEPKKNGRHKEPQAFDESVEINTPGSYAIDRLQKTLVLTKREAAPTAFSPDRLFISLERNVFPLILRKPARGESFTPLGAPGRKKVTRFLSDRKIPRHLRHTFPVLVSGDEIVAIVGIAVSDAFRITAHTSSCLEISWK